MATATPGSTPSSGLSISIVTPCYHSGSYIGRLHKSLQAQTYKNFEWILVDECSTDDSLEVLRRLPSPGALGTRLYRLPQNSGGAVALGLGFERAVGEAVLYIDHDDEMVPDGLEQIVKAWPLVEDPAICGLFFTRIDPQTGQALGSIVPRGQTFSMSWLYNRRPEIYDSVTVMKNPIAKRFLSASALEPICMIGVPLVEMTKDYYFVAGGGRGLIYFHRDNPDSITNAPKISRKSVYTWARQLDLFDLHYLYRPAYWARYMVALIKFSSAVHHDPTYHNRYIRSPLVRLMTFGLLPAGLVSYFFGEKLTLREAPPYDLSVLESLPDLRAATS